MYSYTNNRGGYRGRGRGRGGGNSFSSMPDRIGNLLEGLEAVPLLTMERPTTISLTSQDNAQIANMQLLASYNWIESQTAKIVVPGTLV